MFPIVFLSSICVSMCVVCVCVCHHFKPRIPNCPKSLQTNQKPHSSEVCRKDSAGTPAMEAPRKDSRTEDPSSQLSPPSIAPRWSLWHLHTDLSVPSAAYFCKTGAKEGDIQALHSFNTNMIRQAPCGKCTCSTTVHNALQRTNLHLQVAKQT